MAYSTSISFSVPVYIQFSFSHTVFVMSRDVFSVRVVMVVGAGRGPLVRASFAASKACGHAIKVYAIEKNPNAVVT